MELFAKGFYKQFHFGAGTTTRTLPYNNVAYTGPIAGPFRLTGVSVKSPGNASTIGQTGQPLTVRVT